MSKNGKHKHQYILRRRAIKGKSVFEFYECIAPLCPERDKLVIRPRKKGEK